MTNLIKQIPKRFSVLAIALVFSISAIPACSSTGKTTVESKGAADGTDHSNLAANATMTAENKSAENKRSNESAAKSQTDGLPELKKGEDYKKSVREKMLKTGWKPARSKGADWCGSAQTVCDQFEEYESQTGKGFVSFRWQKGNKVVEILTVGETQGGGDYIYDKYEFEKNSQTIAQNERWNEFWTDFKTAVNKKDRERLKLLMAEKIDGGGDVETASQRLDAIEEGDMWKSMQQTVAEGTKIEKCDQPCRTTKDGYLIFEYTMANWKWSALGGEGVD